MLRSALLLVLTLASGVLELCVARDMVDCVVELIVDRADPLTAALGACIGGAVSLTSSAVITSIADNSWPNPVLPS